jgi:NO-binding membrane sensor protein with MHYT domain
MIQAFAIEGSYDYRLVALSLVIAFLASYTAIDMAGRVTENRGFARARWLLGGSLAMGSGIWCMHFTGMLAFRLPIPVYYDLSTVVVSLLAAIVASGIALYIVSRPRMTRVHLVAGSVLMGAGIATMHYTGMAAMRMRAMHYYDHTLPALFLSHTASWRSLATEPNCRQPSRASARYKTFFAHRIFVE